MQHIVAASKRIKQAVFHTQMFGLHNLNALLWQIQMFDGPQNIPRSILKCQSTVGHMMLEKL